jgi:glc operon protein GlcG
MIKVLLMLIITAGALQAQLADRKAISLEAAKRMMAAAEAEARKNNWSVAIAIVDEGGELIAFHKLDDTQIASVNVAIGKARTAARFKRPTKALEDAVNGGRSVLIAVDGITPLEGGIPVIVDGRVIGAVGVSGVTSQQDAQVAQAGVNALSSR